MRISDWSSDVCSSDLEVQAWDAVSDFDGPAVRTPFVSLLFAPADYTVRWQAAGDLSAATAGISGAVFADDGQEAQGIALLMREAIETPGRTAALVTPDRTLAERVAAALARWDIRVDDRDRKSTRLNSRH